MVRAESCSQPHLTAFTNGTHASVADSTPDKGGGGAGFRPHDLLEAAVACCMNMTLRMAAEKDGVSLGAVAVTVSLDRSVPDTATFEYLVEWPSDVPGPVRARLLAALDRCPVRATLSRSLRFAHRPR